VAKSHLINDVIPHQLLMNDDLLTRITVSPDICHGKPCVRGLRYPVERCCGSFSTAA
jgi:Protein of unknown function (DUF433)